MAEASLITFTYKEILEALIKQQGIHEGIWGIYVEFGLVATNAGPSEDAIVPTAVVPVSKIGIQRMEAIGNVSVDAAVVNPRPSQ